MSVNKRILRLMLLAGVSAVHGVVLLWWDRQPLPGLPPPPPQAIPVLLLPAPPARQQSVPATPKAPVQRPRAIAEKSPHRKKQKQRRTKGPVKVGNPAIIQGPGGASQHSSPYGIWTVRPQAPLGSALARLMRAFDCARLTPQYGRLGCPPVPFDLMTGMEDKIAAIAALEEKGIYSPYGPRLQRQSSGAGQVLGTSGPVGAASSDAALERIPPKYPDPSFGD